ncbi:ExbD/TolR family protein [Altererythrobacter sp. MF3-039]|uniref:ExbD/TolR family protein n=1 Tax=Altererythrobacter sp. MF3-039 TaxID=3252901 RepID=UPI00390C9838
MNTTPLIDVLLVLIIMIIITIPILTHSLKVPLPTGPGGKAIEAVNTVSIDRQDRLYWNGEVLGRQELLNQLASSANHPDDVLIHFEPDPDASYDASARTIALIKDSGIETFAFVGNHKYREFESGD